MSEKFVVECETDEAVAVFTALIVGEKKLSGVKTCLLQDADEMKSAMMDGHDLAKSEYRDTIQKLEAHLEQAECPHTYNPIRLDDGNSWVDELRLCTNGRLYDPDTEDTTDLGPCPWCADRKQLLGERG